MSGAAPLEFTATVAVWMSPGERPMHVMESIERGNFVSAANALTFYGHPSKAEFCDWIRVGEADVTVRLLPRDEQVRMAVAALQRTLAEERAKWLTRQQEILAEISKLQALPGVEVVS